MNVDLNTDYRIPRLEPVQASELSLKNPDVQKAMLALQTAMDSRTFLKAAEQLVLAALPCDVVHTLLHFSMERGRSSIAWGSDGVVFTNEYVRASLVGNPIGWVFATKRGVKTFALCDCYPHLDDMERDPFFHRFIQRMGSQHATVLIFWRENFDGADLVISPHRGPQWPKFSPEEVAIMEAIHPHIDAAYQRVNKLQSRHSAQRGLEEFVRLLPLPAMLVDWDLALLFHNAPASSAAAQWSGAGSHPQPATKDPAVPADLLVAIEAMREEWTHALHAGPGEAQTLFRERVIAHPRYPTQRALISMTALRSPHFGRPSFVIRFELSGNDAAKPLAALTRLSPREQKLVKLVCEGQSNQEIAETIGRSVNTVKSELHGVFKKLGIPSRARLMALLR